MKARESSWENHLMETKERGGLSAKCCKSEGTTIRQVKDTGYLIGFGDLSNGWRQSLMKVGDRLEWIEDRMRSTRESHLKILDVKEIEKKPVRADLVLRQAF